MIQIAGVRQLPTQHITIRVPWHDSGWNGKICQNPCANTSCMVLPRIGTGKNEVAEAGCAGQSLQGMDESALPPCVDEHGTFMADFSIHKLKQHPYKFAKTHEHFASTPFRFEPHSAAAIPFRWMLKEYVEGSKRYTPGLAKELELGYDPIREPKMENIPETWVQEGNNQKIMLETFFSAIQPQDSLVFFYAKRTPLSDSPRRVIVGVGRVTGIGTATEYLYANGKRSANAISGFLWERPISHSIRANPEHGIDGFLLPYHDLLRRADEDPSLDLERFVAFAPEEAFNQYSYGSEHLSQDNAIASLLSVERALQEISGSIDGPWQTYREWIDVELNRLWKLRGPYPGFGAALCAFGVENGNLLAWHLASQIQDGDDHSVWDAFEKILHDAKQLPKYLQKSVGTTLAKKWRSLDAGRKALLQLLSRFEISNDQATFWFQQDTRKELEMPTDEELRRNPYLLFEAGGPFPLQFATIDRGLFAARELEGIHELPDESRVNENNDVRRVRAVMVDRLEHAATEEGHTILPQSWLIDRIRDMPLSPICSVDADLLPIFDEDLPPMVSLIKEGDERYYQLRRYAETKECIAQEIGNRMEGIGFDDEFDWASLVNQAIEKKTDESTWDEQERMARAEKAVALRMIYQSRVSVLMGAAGTGKSTLIKALCDIPKVQHGGVLLLAPTGKARVRLEQASGMAGKGKTIAQFLNGLQRYDGDIGRYFMNPRAPRAAGQRTVVIDECSMLTEDQLAAVLDALEGVDRLILVGDPKQLPPIGAGRPYVDICAQLKPINAEQLAPRVVKGYAELLVTRRQQASDARHDLAFANLFSGAAQDVSADDNWNLVSGGNSHYIEVQTWETTEDISKLLSRALAKELGFSSDDDALGFEKSYGGEEYEGRAYFWPRKKDQNEGGAAAKAEQWQILSPLRNSEVGADALNRMLQSRCRTEALKMSAVSGYKRRIPQPMGPHRILWGDKVINVQNSARRKTWPEKAQAYVANGEIGVATGFFRRRDMKYFFSQLEVEMATQPGTTFHYKEWEFDADMSPPLELAYALTVHKTQGSEFKKTFLVLPRQCRLLSREMLYTALTRHSEKVTLLIQGELRDLYSYTLDFASETKRRMTNLFATSRPVTVAFGHRRFQLDDRLIYRTDRGELVRSKSEWIIADKLHSVGLGYVYEPEVQLAGKPRWPDFVISDNQRGITWYWEHLGRMDLPEYQERWKAKHAAYLASGIVPPSQFKSGKSTGVLVTTQEDGKTTDLSEQIARTLELIQNPQLG